MIWFDLQHWLDLPGKGLAGRFAVNPKTSETAWDLTGNNLAANLLSFCAVIPLEDAMNVFTQLQRWFDPANGSLVLAIALVSVAAAVVLVLAP